MLSALQLSCVCNSGENSTWLIWIFSSLIKKNKNSQLELLFYLQCAQLPLNCSRAGQFVGYRVAEPAVYSKCQQMSLFMGQQELHVPLRFSPFSSSYILSYKPCLLYWHPRKLVWFGSGLISLKFEKRNKSFFASLVVSFEGRTKKNATGSDLQVGHIRKTI